MLSNVVTFISVNGIRRDEFKSEDGSLVPVPSIGYTVYGLFGMSQSYKVTDVSCSYSFGDDGNVVTSATVTVS